MEKGGKKLSEKRVHKGTDRAKERERGMNGTQRMRWTSCMEAFEWLEPTNIFRDCVKAENHEVCRETLLLLAPVRTGKKSVAQK